MVRQIALAYWRTACRFRRKILLDCDGRYEPIAASWDIDDVTASSESITERASQCRDMNCNIGRHHARVRPDFRHELLFAHQLAGAFEQDDEQGRLPRWIGVPASVRRRCIGDSLKGPNTINVAVGSAVEFAGVAIV